MADCSGQSLNQVPNNDYFDHLQASAGNNQMPTLNRDIQQLNLASNNISNLSGSEFFKKKFRNLQKIYLNTNQLRKIDSSAFYKLTGLVELDLSENMISGFDDKLIVEGNHNATDSVDSLAVVIDQRTSTNHRQVVGAGRRREGRIHGVRTFLQDLTQLRQLNLASNRLTRLDEFTFSPLTQLHQLYLSR